MTHWSVSIDVIPSAVHQEADRPAKERCLAAIHKFEQDGDYLNALKIARDFYLTSFPAAPFAPLIERLEAAHLRFGFSRILFDEKMRPRENLLRILTLTGMESSAETSLDQINAWAQQNLLRQGERWEVQTERFEPLRPLILPLLKETGFVDARLPQFAEYQGALVQGALLPRVRLRMHELVQQWKRGVRFPKLYFLSGERPLEPKYESGWSESATSPKNEWEMIQWVWEQAQIPEEMRKGVEVYFIKTPMKKDPASEKLLRPNNEDTVETWLATRPPPGRYLVVTNAPFTNRQDVVTRMIAPEDYGFDTIGPAASPEEKIAIFLDELARLIFQTKGCR